MIQDGDSILTLFSGNLTRYLPFLPVMDYFNQRGVNWVTLITLPKSIDWKHKDGDNITVFDKNQYLTLKKIKKISKIIHLNDLNDFDLNPLYDDFPIRLIILFGDQSFIERALILSSHARKIPTVFIQIATITYSRDVSLSERIKRYLLWRHKVSLFYYRSKYFIHTLIGNFGFFSTLKLWLMTTIDTLIHFRSEAGRFAEYYVVFGSEQIKTLMRRGISKDRFILITNPFVYFLYSQYTKIIQDQNSLLQLRKKFGLKEHQKVITIATQSYVEHGLWNEEQRKLFLTILLTTIYQVLKSGRNQQCQDFTILIKLHPGENEEIYQKLVQEIITEKAMDLQVIQCRDCDLVTVLAISDIWITTFSTTVYYSTLAKKPTIIVNFFNEEPLDFALIDPIIYTQSIKQFNTALTRVINESEEIYTMINKTQPSFIRKFCWVGREDDPYEKLFQRLTSIS